MEDPKTKRILVVDDDDMHCEILGIALRHDGFQVEQAGNGQEALDRVKVSRPDLITMDIAMPVMNGFEAIRQLKAIGFGAIPVIVISAHAHYTPSKEDEAACAEPNVCDFINKPIIIKRLLERVHQILKTQSPQAPPPAAQ
jgi:CheY-like chemotaxis protein